MTKKETILKQIKALFQQLFTMENISTGAGNKIYEEAMKRIGTDASPRDLANDFFGCAESVTTILKAVDPRFPIITGTWTLWDYLEKSPFFVKVTKPVAGDIIINPTSALYTGHVGIFKDDNLIISNDSNSGLFKQNYTLSTWRATYKNKLPEFIYRCVV